MRVTPLQPFGIKVTDFDVNNPDHTSKLPSLLYANGIILLPKDAPAPGAPSVSTVDSLSKLGALFGTPLMQHDVDKFVKPGQPVSALRTGGDTGVGPDAFYFHSDVSWWADPHAVGLLASVVRPADGGGYTLFQNAHMMYNRISQESREFLLNHRFENSLYFAYAMGNRPEIADSHADALHVHPGVIRHPKFGYPIPYISRQNSRSVEGMTPEESRPILNKILGAMYSDEQTYAHKWDVGDVMIWDNFGVQHKVNNDYKGKRIVHRVMVTGDHLPPTKYEPQVKNTSENMSPVPGAVSISA